MDFPNIIRAENFLTPKQYTEIGGLSINTAMNRIKSNLVSHIRLDGKFYIYVENVSPKQNRHGRIQKDPVVFPSGVRRDRLVNISTYCKSKKIPSDRFYRALLSGKIFGLVIAGDVYAYKDEMEKL